MAITNGNFVQSRKSSAGNLIFHLEEKYHLNEEITVHNLTRYDIETFFDEAAFNNTKNAVFHMQFSPSLDQSSDKYHIFEKFLKREYNLSDHDFYAVEHAKQRQLTDTGLGADTHRHYVFGVVDTNNIDRKNRDFSFFKIRNEKLSRMFEIAAGEPLTNGAHDDKVFEVIMKDEAFLSEYGHLVAARADEIKALLSKEDKPQSSYDGQMKMRAEENNLSLPALRKEMKGMSVDEAAQHFKFVAEAYGLSVQIGKQENKMDHSSGSKRRGKQSNQAFLVDGNGNIVLNMSRTSGHSRIKGTEWAERFDGAIIDNYITPEIAAQEPQLNEKQIKARQRRDRRVKETLARLDTFIYGENKHDTDTAGTADASRGGELRGDRDLARDAAKRDRDAIKFGQHGGGDDPALDEDTTLGRDGLEADQPLKPGAGSDIRSSREPGREHSRSDRADSSISSNNSKEHISADRYQQHNSRTAADRRSDHEDAQRLARSTPQPFDGGLNADHLNPMARMKMGRRNAWKNNARYNKKQYTFEHLMMGALMMVVGLLFKLVAPNSAIGSEIIDAGRRTATGYNPPTDKQIQYNMAELSEASKRKPRIAALRLKTQEQRRQNVLLKVDPGKRDWISFKHRVTDQLGFFDDQMKYSVTHQRDREVNAAIQNEMKRQDQFYRDFTDGVFHNLKNKTGSFVSINHTLSDLKKEVRAMNSNLSEERIQEEFLRRSKPLKKRLDAWLKKQNAIELQKSVDAANRKAKKPKKIRKLSHAAQREIKLKSFTNFVNKSDKFKHLPEQRKSIIAEQLTAKEMMKLEGQGKLLKSSDPVDLIQAKLDQKIASQKYIANQKYLDQLKREAEDLITQKLDPKEPVKAFTKDSINEAQERLKKDSRRRKKEERQAKINKTSKDDDLKISHTYKPSKSDDNDLDFNQKPKF